MDLKKRIEELIEAGKKLRGVGFTRRNKKEPKKTKKTAKLSRKKNRQIANKKFRKTGSKRRE